MTELMNETAMMNVYPYSQNVITDAYDPILPPFIGQFDIDAEDHADNAYDDYDYVGSIETPSGGAEIYAVYDQSGNEHLIFSGWRSDSSQWRLVVPFSENIRATLNGAADHIHCGQARISNIHINEYWYQRSNQDGGYSEYVEADVNERMDLPTMTWQDLYESGVYDLDIVFKVVN